MLKVLCVLAISVLSVALSQCGAATSLITSGDGGASGSADGGSGPADGSGSVLADGSPRLADAADSGG